MNRVLFTFVVSPSTFTLQFFSRCCKASVPPFVHAVVPPSEKRRLLRNVTRVTSCLGVAGVSVAGNSFVSSIRRHGGRGEVGVAELTACPRFTLEDQGRSTTISSKRRHHMVSGSNSSTTRAASPRHFGLETSAAQLLLAL